MINSESTLVVFVFCFALIAGLVAPTFPDEITNIFLTAKVDFNNPIRDWLIPSCLKTPS